MSRWERTSPHNSAKPVAGLTPPIMLRNRSDKEEYGHEYDNSTVFHDDTSGKMAHNGFRSNAMAPALEFTSGPECPIVARRGEAYPLDEPKRRE